MESANLRRTLFIAVVVGAVLTAVNQGEVLAQGEVSVGLVLRMVANVAIPFVVSNLGVVSSRLTDSGVREPVACEPQS